VLAKGNERAGLACRCQHVGLAFTRNSGVASIFAIQRYMIRLVRKAYGKQDIRPPGISNVAISGQIFV